MTRAAAIATLALGAVVSASPPAAAQTWTGNTSGSWATGTNWSSLPAGGINTQLIFGATANATMTDDIGGTFLLNRMTFNAGDPAYTLTGNPLDFRTNAGAVLPTIVMNSANNVTIGTSFGPLTLTNNLTVSGAGAGALTVNASMSGAGSLTYAGAGTLALGNGNTYSGGTFVASGALALTSGFAIPFGGAVTVASGAQFNIGSLSNASFAAVGTLNLNGGTFRVPSGSGNYYLNQLQMTGGTVDFTGTSNFGLHFTGAGAGITINPGVSTWIGGGTSRIQNDTSGPLTIAVTDSGLLNAGIILSRAGGNPNFILSGGGVRLSNTANTANITVTGEGKLYANDLSTDVGPGAFGTLGSGTITLNNYAYLVYDGGPATSAKPLTLANVVANVVVANAGTNLAMTGVIGESAPGTALQAMGPARFAGQGTSTLTLLANNTYTGPTFVTYGSILAVPRIDDAGAGGAASPIGASSNAPGNLVLGFQSLNARGTLLLTGTNATYGTDRGATVEGQYIFGDGGAVGVQAAGTTLTVAGQVTGSGSLIKVGPGTLVISNAANNFAGGAYVEAGRLTLGSGTAMPTGGNVTVSAGAEFNTAGLSNGTSISSSNAIGTVTLNGGTLRVPSGNGDYYLNRLATSPAGGTVDFTGSSNSWLHLTGAGAGITVAGDSTWVGAPGSHIQNDTTAPVDINVVNYPFAKLTNGVILANGTNGQGFRLTGAPGLVSVMELTTLGNTADLIADSTGYLRVADMAFLGSGSLTLQNTAHDLRPGTLWYTGPTAPSSKPITLGVGGGQIYVLTPGTNLTLSGTIGDPPASPGQPLQVSGAFSAPATLTLTGANTFTGGVAVFYQGVLSIGTITDGGVPSPLGASGSAPSNLQLGAPPSLQLGLSALLRSGSLQYTGPTAITDRGVMLNASIFDVDPNVNALEVTNPATNLTFNGQFTGTGGLTKTGPGTLTLGGATNNYAGGTFVNAGRLALGSGTAVPAGGNVTVAAGATFDTARLGNSAAPIGTVALNGGTLLAAPTDPTNYYLNKLVTDAAGGTIDATGSTASRAGLLFTNAGAAVTVSGNSTWTGPASFYVGNVSGSELPIVVAAGVTVTSSLSLVSAAPSSSNPMRISGGGTLYLTNPAVYSAVVRVNHTRLRMDDLTAVAPGGFDLTLDAGTLAYGGPTASSAAAFALAAGGGTVEVVNAATTLTLTGAIAGTGSATLTKAGPGTLALTNTANTYFGGLTVNAGRLEVSDDAQLGLANPVVNPAGTLRYTASTTTARTFAMNFGTLEAPAGVTLTLDGATVSGGFLAGGGTFATAAGGSTSFFGDSTTTSTTITLNGSDSLTNLSQGGRLTVAAGRTVTLARVTNAASGRLTVSGTANVSDFVSDGLLTVNPGGAISNSGTDLYLGGGSTTFVGAPSASGGKIDLGGRNLQLRGGLLVNYGGSAASGNGVRNGTVVVDYGGRAKGTGYFEDVVTQNGGVFSPGGAPGTTPVGTQRFNNGGILNIDVNAAGPGGAPPGGASGADPGWSRLDVNSFFRFYPTADQHFTISLTSLTTADTAGPVSNFDATRAHSWEVVRLVPGSVFVTGATGTTPADPSAYAPGLVDVQTAGTFLNPLLGGSFATAFQPNGVGTYSVFVNFTPAPEAPGVLAACAAAAGWVCFRRRRWRNDLIRSNDSMRGIGRRGPVARP